MSYRVIPIKLAEDVNVQKMSARVGHNGTETQWYTLPVRPEVAARKGVLYGWGIIGFGEAHAHCHVSPIRPRDLLQWRKPRTYWHAFKQWAFLRCEPLTRIDPNLVKLLFWGAVIGYLGMSLVGWIFFNLAWPVIENS